MAEAERKQQEAIEQEKERHQYVVQQMADFYQPFLDLSSDGMFVYLDDEHKTCNQNLADMFGYTVEEWSAIQPFLDKLVAPESRDEAMAAYREVRQDGVSRISVQTCLRRDGSKFQARIALIPIIAGDDFFTINLVRPV